MPTVSSALFTPRITVDMATLTPSILSVVPASFFRLPRNLSAVLAWNTGPLTMTKSCVRPSAPGRRSPSTSSTFNARPRGRLMVSGKMSPALVDSRMNTTCSPGLANMPCANSGGRPDATVSVPCRIPCALACTDRTACP